MGLAQGEAAMRVGLAAVPEIEAHFAAADADGSLGHGAGERDGSRC